MSSGRDILPLFHFEQLLAGEHVRPEVIVGGRLDEAELQIVERVERRLVLAVGGGVAGVAKVSPEKWAAVEHPRHRRLAQRVRLRLVLPGQYRHQIWERVVAHLVVPVEPNPAGVAEVSVGERRAAHKVQSADAVDAEHQDAQLSGECRRVGGSGVEGSGEEAARA